MVVCKHPVDTLDVDGAADRIEGFRLHGGPSCRSEDSFLSMNVHVVVREVQGRNGPLVVDIASYDPFQIFHVASSNFVAHRLKGQVRPRQGAWIRIQPLVADRLLPWAPHALSLPRSLHAATRTSPFGETYCCIIESLAGGTVLPLIVSSWL